MVPEVIMKNSLRKLQLAELEVLKKTLCFFEEHGISYYALGGTLLGAVRHKGFIPWDDDVDIGVPREDYDRMMALLEQGDSGLEFRTYYNCQSYYCYFIKIVDPTVRVRRAVGTIEGVAEAWVDVFPLDGMPRNTIQRQFHEMHILYRRIMYLISSFSKTVDIKRKNRSWIKRFAIRLLQVIPVEQLLDEDKEFAKLDSVIRYYPYSSSEYLVNAMGIYKFREIFHKKYYGEGRMYPFEDIWIHGPENYDAVLTQLYGDYMTPPPENDPERNHHQLQEIVFDEEERS